MRHSTSVSRVLALATLTALAAGTVGIGGSALARDPSKTPFDGRSPVSRAEGEGFMTGSGTRGMVDPKELPKLVAGSGQHPDKPSFARTAASAAGPAALAPSGVPVAPDPVEVTATGNAPAGQPGDDGFFFLSGPATNRWPPDPWVAVGPDHVIQTVNASMQILDRSGNLIVDATLASFFALPPGYGTASPRVIFDSLHQRWVMTEVSWACNGFGGFGYIDYLVSSTADPTDPWRLDYLEFKDVIPDSPAPGTSTVNLGFAANIFKMNTTGSGTCYEGDFGFLGTTMLVADWAQVVRPPGAPRTLIREFPLESTHYFNTRMAVQAPATSPTMYGVYQYQPLEGGPIQPVYFSWVGSAVADTIQPAGGTNLTTDGIVAPWVDPPPDPQQPGMPATVTTYIDSAVTDAIWQSNKLTWVSTDGCTPSGDLSLQDCVRVTQVATNGPDPNRPPLIQDFLIAGADKDNYFGGIGQALDGTLHVVWTTSSAASIYPSSYTAYQLPGDPDNSLSAPELLKAGVAQPFTGTAWGFYTGVAQDPQVPNAVWQGNMYSGGGNVWRTFISQLQTGGSSYVPIPPIRVLDTRPAYNIGLSGTFKANVPRTFAVGGAFGIPADAIAVTGNVTIANQTAAGYLSVTPIAVVNPTSSTINFPLGDTRANNLTVPLATNGKLAAVYKAPAGKTSHVIVDITGYFLAGNEDATYSTLTPVRVLDTRPAYHIGLSGTFKTAIPRKLQIAGVSGVPDDATAITGNLTVVGQTKAGYLSITTTSVPNPTTSNLNFPLGDTRANGVSVPLNATGELWIVYKAAPGGTTHVVLDVTGYYREDPAGLLFYPLTPGRVLDSRPGKVLSGLSGPFKSSTPRRLDIAGHWGAPLGAAAVTGNLTVVGQQAAGYVSATLTSEANPTTSVLNFPLGDVRANGVTLPLNVGGRSWFVYKASSGKLTHLVLDLSGYFD